MRRSLFVIENSRGEFWMTQREHDAKIDAYAEVSRETEPTSRVTEYAPLVRCKECKHASGMDQYPEHSLALCGGIGPCAGRWHPADWYCADAEETA